jgi:lysophospholipase L1-like esterase
MNRPLQPALRFLRLALLGGWAAAALAALAAPAPAPGLDLRDGDTMVFAGDSITHQCLYSQYVENFFFTRFPERRIRFHNAGVGGDRAADVLARFDDDIATHRPRYVTVLLGMNDGQYEDFKPEIFAQYAADVLRLLDRIKRSGATAILLSPTPFDYPVFEWRKDDPTYRFRTKPRSPNYNAVLAYYGAWGRDQAFRRGLPYVNLWGPLNDFTAQGRAADPKFTLLPDAIHPGPGGHVIMASALIETLRPERRAVSALNLTRTGDRWRAAPSLKLENLAGNDTHVTFTFTAAALPWVIPPEASTVATIWGWQEDARRGFELTRAGHRLSNEMLRLAGLAPGSYEIKIDGHSIGKPVSHVTLGAKIELQANANTPQYQQALQVALLNRERNDQAVRPLREVWAKVKGARRKHAREPARFAEFMVATHPEIDRLEKLARDFEDRIYAAARPVPRRYEITRVATPAPVRPKKK